MLEVRNWLGDKWRGPIEGTAILSFVQQHLAPVGRDLKHIACRHYAHCATLISRFRTKMAFRLAIAHPHELQGESDEIRSIVGPIGQPLDLVAL